jgi:fumarate hydratase class II
MCVVAPAVLKRRLKLQQQASKRLLASQPAHVLKAAAQASTAAEKVLCSLAAVVAAEAVQCQAGCVSCLVANQADANAIITVFQCTSGSSQEINTFLQ